MTEEIELRLLKEIEALKQEIRIIKSENQETKPTYQYSKIRDNDLEGLVDIEKLLDKAIFKQWFENNIFIDSNT